MNKAQIDYIWKNYGFLINQETGHSKYLRAALFPINESWPDAEEIRSLKLELSLEQLRSRISDIESRRDSIALEIYEKYKHDIFFNYCPNCQELATTPCSERCIKCRNTWYGTNPQRDHWLNIKPQ